VIKAVRDYFDSHGFTLVDTPIFTPAACEGTTTLFEVNYFDDEKVFLTQSGQLYNEADAMAFGKVYCFGPTFRAEKSKTRRHLDRILDGGTGNGVCHPRRRKTIGRGSDCLRNRPRAGKPSHRTTSPGTRHQQLETVKAPFPRMSYDDAVKALQARGSEIQWGGDFGGPDETMITEGLDRPLMVDRYPTQVKAFYFEPDPDRPELALGVDVIAPEGYGELIGGGQRIHNLNLLMKRLEEHKLPPEAFNWYIDLRKYGSVPHAGFGMGIERFRSLDVRPGTHSRDHPYPRMLYRTRP